MNNNRGTVKNIFLILALIFLIMTIGAGMAAYFYFAQQQKRIQSKESEILNLKSAQETLKAQMADIEAAQKKLAEDNARMAQEAEKYTGEKNVILTQVRSSVSAFEVFRKDATDEIAKLKESLSGLENEKKNLSEKLEATEMAKTEEREALEAEIKTLNERIDDHKKTELELAKNLEAKERVPIVVQNAKMHYNLGNFYFRNKQYKSAAEEYKQAIAYTPDDADMHYNLALVSDEYIGDYATAIDHYRKYVQLNPKAKDAKKVQLRAYDLEVEISVKEEIPRKENIDRFKSKSLEMPKIKA